MASVMPVLASGADAAMYGQTPDGKITRTPPKDKGIVTPATKKARALIYAMSPERSGTIDPDEEAKRDLTQDLETAEEPDRVGLWYGMGEADVSVKETPSPSVQSDASTVLLPPDDPSTVAPAGQKTKDERALPGSSHDATLNYDSGPAVAANVPSGNRLGKTRGYGALKASSGRPRTPRGGVPLGTRQTVRASAPLRSAVLPLMEDEPVRMGLPTATAGIPAEGQRTFMAELRAREAAMMQQLEYREAAFEHRFFDREEELASRLRLCEGKAAMALRHRESEALSTLRLREAESAAQVATLRTELSSEWTVRESETAVSRMELERVLREELHSELTSASQRERTALRKEATVSCRPARPKWLAGSRLTRARLSASSNSAKQSWTACEPLSRRSYPLRSEPARRACQPHRTTLNLPLGVSLMMRLLQLPVGRKWQS